MISLLDTSALLAHYRDETGAAEVQALFEDKAASIAIASITITEFSRRMTAQLLCVQLPLMFDAHLWHGIIH